MYTSVYVTFFTDQLAVTSSSSKGIQSNIEASGKLLKQLYRDLSSALNTSGVDVEEEISESTSQEEVLAEKEVLSLDKMLSEITTGTVIIFLNIASLSYQHHQYESCRLILEKLLEFLTIEPLDSGISLKVCFLLTEVILYQWNHGDSYHTEEEFVLFESQILLVLTAAAKYVLMSADDEDIDESTDVNAIDLQDLLGDLLDYRIKLYLCRMYIALELYEDAQRNLDSAIMVYEKRLRPVANDIGESIVLTDIQNMKISLRYIHKFLYKYT
jgi:hypothetical protein